MLEQGSSDQVVNPEEQIDSSQQTKPIQKNKKPIAQQVSEIDKICHVFFSTNDLKNTSVLNPQKFAKNVENKPVA